SAGSSLSSAPTQPSRTPSATRSAPQGGLRLRPDPPGRPVITAMFFSIGGRKRGLADTAQPMHGRNGGAAFIAFERCLDRGQRVVAAQKMLRDADRNIGDRERLPRKSNCCWRLALGHKFAKAQTRGLVGDAKQLATAHMVAESWQFARLYRHEEHEARPHYVRAS